MKVSDVIIPAAAAVAAAEAASAPLFKPFDTALLALDSLLEQFQYANDEELGRVWVLLDAKKDEEFAYIGKWLVEEPTVYPGLAGDRGLVAKLEAAHHAISHRLGQVFDNKDNTLVMQYEVKLQKGLSCGGAYIKLLLALGFNGDEPFLDKTPYQVMFGPDRCGASNKVHLIIRRPDPTLGEVVEHHMNGSPFARTVKTLTLYTLVIKPNNDYEVRINGEVARSGNLLDENEFTPPFNAPKEIEDPNAAKPDEWDDRMEIPDPEETEKPEDWDELQPGLIDDPTAVKPDDWLDDEELYIPDPEAEKPEDWDDEEDGEWLAPEVRNPKCRENGCGVWKAPRISNPLYRGKWVQPYIENPDYQGPWFPPKIENPDYFEDLRACDLEAIGGLGFEIWTMDSDILFDNIYLGHSVEEAEKVGNSLFTPKLVIEEELMRAEYDEIEMEAKSNTEEPPAEADDGLLVVLLVERVEGVARRALELTNEFVADPLEVLTTKPVEVAVTAGSFVLVFTLVFGLWSTLLFVLTGPPTAEQRDALLGKKKVEAAVEELEEEAEEVKASAESTAVSGKKGKATKRL